MPNLVVAIEQRQFVQGAQEVVRAERAMGAGARELDKDLTSTDRKLRKTSSAAGLLRRSMVGLFAGLSLVAGLRASTQTITEYSDSMATLRAVAVSANVPLEQQAEVYGRLEAKSRELGATTRYTASQSAEGLLFLARAGFDAQQQLDAIDSTLNLATVGMLSLGEAADIASNLVSQFGLDASETERVVDSLTNTSNRSNTSVRQMAEAMVYAGPVANALGQELEMTASAIGVLGDSGIQSSMAGTNLRMVMLSLAAPTAGARAAIKGLGLELDEVNPAKRNLVEVFEAFGSALDEVEDSSRKAAIANEIFGVRNVAAALIMADSTEKMAFLTQEQRENAEATRQQAQEMEDTLGGSLRSMRSAIESVILVTGDAGLTGILRGVVDGVTIFARSLAGVEAPMNNVSTLARAISGALMNVADNVHILIMLSLGAWLYSAAAAGTTLNGVMVTLWATMRAHPILALIGIVAAAGAAMAVFSRDTKDAANSVDDLATELDDLHNIATRVARSDIALDRAMKLGDLDNQISSSMQRLRALEDLSVKLRGMADGDILPMETIVPLRSEFEFLSDLMTVMRRDADGNLQSFVSLERVLGPVESQITTIKENLASMREDAIAQFTAGGPEGFFPTMPDVDFAPPIQTRAWNVGPMLRWQTEMAEIIRMNEQGVLVGTEYNDMLRQAELNYQRTTRTLSGGLRAGLLAVQEEMGDLAGLAENAVVNSIRGVEDALVSVATTGKAHWRSLIDSMLADLLRLMIRMQIMMPLMEYFFPSGPGGGSGEGAPAAASGPDTGGFVAPPEFEHGADFMVGGSGGVDSQLVAFRASPNERVRVTRPDQEAKGGGTNVVVNVNNNSDASARVERRETSSGVELDVIIEQVVASSIRRGGAVGSAVQQRFNLNPAAGIHL